MTRAFRWTRVLLAIEPAKRLRLVILDACRDNPFTKTMKRTVASRAIGQGLAKIEPTSPNMLIAYSAKAGSTALDGDGKNSPFTIALAKHLTTPGLDVRRAFGFVRDDVLKTTNNRQEPFVYGSLGGEDVPLVPAPKAAPSTPAPNPQAEVRRDYELALQVGNKSALNAFLAQYPNGFYASLARLQLDKIAAEEARVAATEKATAGRAGAGAARRRRRPKSAADQGSGGRESGGAGAACGRKSQAGRAGAGRGGRAETRRPPIRRPSTRLPRTAPRPAKESQPSRRRLNDRRRPTPPQRAAVRRRPRSQNRCRPSCAASAV